LSEKDEISVRNRTKAVLDGTDPVMIVLNGRIKNVFKAMIEWNPSASDNIPSVIRAGLPLPLGGPKSDTSAKKAYRSAFLEAARREFVSKGFAFYAPQLAEASFLSSRIINLALVLHGELLDQLLEAEMLNRR